MVKELLPVGVATAEAVALSLYFGAEPKVFAIAVTSSVVLSAGVRLFFILREFSVSRRQSGVNVVQETPLEESPESGGNRVRALARNGKLPAKDLTGEKYL